METKLNIELEREIVSLIEREFSRRSNGLNNKLLERMVRVEEALVHQRELMQEGFKAVDKRLELMQNNIDKRFEAMDKRFELMQNNIDRRFDQVMNSFRWTIGLVVGSAVAIIGVIIKVLDF